MLNPRIKLFTCGPVATNTYVLLDEDSLDAVVIDPGTGSELVLEWIRSNRVRIDRIINTHAHFDHSGGNRLFKSHSDADLLIHVDDAPMLESIQEQGAWFGIEVEKSPKPDVLLEDGDEITVGKIRMTVIHTPGHSPGGICLLMGNTLFSGDTLFCSGVGRTDLPGASRPRLLKSIRERLFCLPDETIVYPGHGEPTTIGDEKSRWSNGWFF